MKKRKGGEKRGGKGEESGPIRQKWHLQEKKKEGGGGEKSMSGYRLLYMSTRKKYQGREKKQRGKEGLFSGKGGFRFFQKDQYI